MLYTFFYVLDILFFCVGGGDDEGGTNYICTLSMIDCLV